MKRTSTECRIYITVGIFKEETDMKHSTARILSIILSSVLVFVLVLGGFGILGHNGDSAVSVFAVIKLIKFFKFKQHFCC